MTEMTGHNYYNLLGVSVDADQATIAAAYEQQRQRYAPERLVDLDHELHSAAVEVRHIGVDRVLLTEAHSAGASAEPPPEQDFGKAHPAAELAGFAGQRGSRMRVCLTPLALI